MENNKEQDDYISDKIKVFSSEDEKLKMLGELLSNKSSRDIIRLLSGKEMYTNEIAKKLDMRVNLVIHHLRKLGELGLLEITNKEIVRKGNKHRYFKMNPYLFLAPNETKDELSKKGILENFFKHGIKFVGIITAGIISWLAGDFVIKFQNTSITSNADISKPFIETIYDSGIIPIIISQLIVILLTIYLIKKEKNKKSIVVI